MEGLIISAQQKKMHDGTPVAYNRITEWMVDDQWLKSFVPKDPNFYTTNVFTDYAIEWLNEYEKEDKPFLLYMAYNAPHYPIQAPAEDVAKYKGKYDAGYQAIRKARYQKMVKEGIIDPNMSPLYPEKTHKLECIISSKKGL